MRFYYSNSTHNFGDMLNAVLFERIFSLPVEKVHYKKADFFGIGSVLQKLLVPKSAWIKDWLQQWQPQVSVLGSGFIRDFDPKEYVIRRKTTPLAVRGLLSLHLLRSLVPCKPDIVTGDMGIFADQLLDKPPKKRYAIGIIPHYTEQQHELVLRLTEDLPHSTVIDVLKSPIDVIQHIAECELILSSSLHGLIVADALRIPNHHIVMTDLVLGKGFKFQDYYSNYEIMHSPWTPNSLPSVDELTTAIADTYAVQPMHVEAMKQRLYACMKELI